MLGNTKDIKQAVRATEQRVETTEKLAAAMRTDTAAIRKQLADPEQFDADRCPDVRCAVAMGASRKALQRFLDDGVRLPPEILGAALAAWWSRATGTGSTSSTSIFPSGSLRHIDDPSLQVMWGGSSPLAKVVGVPGVPVEVGGSGCMIGRIRVLELAVLAGDHELRAWLLQHGRTRSWRTPGAQARDRHASPSRPRAWAKELRRARAAAP